MKKEYIQPINSLELVITNVILNSSNIEQDPDFGQAPKRTTHTL